MKTVLTLGVPLAGQEYDEALATLKTASTERRPMRVHFATVQQSVTEAHSNVRLREVFESADMVCTDGVPLVWLVRRRGARRAERVCGPDVMLSLCDEGRSLGLRHYFLGGREGTPEALAAALTKRFPGLQVAGTVSPPFGEISEQQDAEIVAAVNAAKPDLLWVGLGSPKQELWAADHEARIDAPLILAVGAAFDYHSGRLRRAPKWIRRIGLEWLFRLAMEPRRLWRRYLTTNVRFAWLVLREEISRRRTRTI